MQLTYPDGSRHEFPPGTTGLDVATSIGSRLAKAAVAVTVDGKPWDLTRPLPEAGGEFAVVTDSTEAGRHVMRHSAAHVLAQAVLELFPEATFAIGPPIEDGFYYDFWNPEPFTPDDLEAIEAKMHEIIAEDQPFVREEMTVDDALEVFARHRFKVEIIESVDPSEVDTSDPSAVTAYRNTDAFTDLCRGPHVPTTGRLRAVRLLRTAGAYWRGDENNPQLQRIYGTAWESQAALEDYLHRVEEAAKRDHRRLGPELDLFSFPRDLGSGLAVWHPKGGLMRKLIEDHSRELHEQFGFDFVTTPHVARAELWETSGHLDYYAENMYPGMELDGDEEYRVKPMNCPGHVLIYKSSARSYRELPMRLSELGAVYRYERSGVVHGLLRARGFTQDDSHTFATPDQLADELAMHLDFVLTWLRDFGFDEFEADLSTRPEKYVGEIPRWEQAEAALGAALDSAGLAYEVAEGEGAFYGPKIDVHVKDAIGRRWQMSTIQVDFNLPERFDLEYTTTDNERERPFMIHAAKAGSLERFFGVLVEHYAGAFPMWLAPVQAVVVTVADRHEDYAASVAGRLRDVGIRAEVDAGSGKLGEKIRRAITQKVPAVLVVGDNDVEGGTAGFRLRGEDERRGTPVEEIVATLTDLATAP
jgi:threonyl-tRNA synthetase